MRDMNQGEMRTDAHFRLYGAWMRLITDPGIAILYSALLENTQPQPAANPLLSPLADMSEPTPSQHFRSGIIRSLAVIQLLCLIIRLAGQIDSQLPEDIFVHLRENDAGMNFGVSQILELFHSASGLVIGGGADRERN